MRTNIKSKTGLIVFGIIFILAGIGIFVLLLRVGLDTKNKKEVWTATTSVIQDIERDTYRSGGEIKTDHDVYVSYVYDGVEHEGELDYYSSTMRIGDEVTIYVNPQNPNEFVDDSSSLLIVMSFIFLIVFPGAGITVIVQAVKGNVQYGAKMRHI